MKNVIIGYKADGLGVWYLYKRPCEAIYIINPSMLPFSPPLAIRFDTPPLLIL